MGNAQFTLNEANAQLPIDTFFLQKYQTHVTTVDHALTGLARGIDALHSTCRLFLQQYSKSTDGQVKDTSAPESEGAVIHIIQKIHECISENKEVTIESMKNFFSFIKETGKDYIENAEETFSSLSVNTYQCLLKEEDDWFTDFYRKRNELLKKEIDMLQKERKIQQELIETLQKQQSLDKEELKTHIKDWIEKNNHKEEKSEYEKTIADLKKKVQILEDDNSKLQQELQENNKVTCKQFTTKKVTVQLYTRSTYSTTKESEEDLLVLLRTEFSKRGLELTVMRCKKAGQVVKGCPLLVTIDHNYYNTRRKNETIQTAMFGLEHTQSTAVLVFHHTDENGLNKELKLYDKEFKSLGGVIHFGYKSFLYNSSINNKGITEVMEFIEKHGTIQQDVVETYFD